MTDPSNIAANTPNRGVTLRDYFAGQALAGIAAAFVRVSRRDGETMAQAEARWCYERADAMLAVRERRALISED